MKCLRCLKGPCSCIPQRRFLIFYVLIGLNLFYWIRICGILALNTMTFAIPKPSVNTSTGDKEQYCPLSEEDRVTNNTNTKSKAEFHWDQKTQHLILQGFYYGYLISNVPGGALADTFGGKIVFAYGFLLSAVVCIMIPFLARISPYCFFAARFVLGLGQGVIFPSLSSMVAKWAPPYERASFIGWVHSGTLFGNSTAFIVASFIMAATPGWEEVFYINGVLGIIWVIGWYVLCYSSPAFHPFVTDKERTMIETEINQNPKNKPKHIPWKSILTSAPVWVAVLCNYGHLWANFTLINEMPLYLNKVVGFSKKGSGIFSATPHIAMIPTTLLGGYLCDWLVKKNIMSITLNRKVFILAANTFPVPFMLAASFMGCDKAWVVILFMVMMFFKGLAYPTIKTQPNDLSPNYAGILMGLINGTGSISGFISPLVVPFFITGDGSLVEWRRFFMLSGCIMIIVTLPFMCFGSGLVQPWNSQKGDEQEENGEEQQTNEPPKATPQENK